MGGFLQGVLLIRHFSKKKKKDSAVVQEVRMKLDHQQRLHQENIQLLLIHLFYYSVPSIYISSTFFQLPG